MGGRRSGGGEAPPYLHLSEGQMKRERVWESRLWESVLLQGGGAAKSRRVSNSYARAHPRGRSPFLGSGNGTD